MQGGQGRLLGKSCHLVFWASGSQGRVSAVQVWGHVLAAQGGQCGCNRVSRGERGEKGTERRPGVGRHSGRCFLDTVTSSGFFQYRVCFFLFFVGFFLMEHFKHIKSILSQLFQHLSTCGCFLFFIVLNLLTSPTLDYLKPLQSLDCISIQSGPLKMCYCT